jgi:hypothetical protein
VKNIFKQLFGKKGNKMENEKEVLEGGLGDDKSLNDLATKHNVPIEQIKAELEKGVKVEAEHTTDPKAAAEIAKDHLTEDPLYYEKLAKMEAEKAAALAVPVINIDEIVAKAVQAATEKVAAIYAAKAQEEQAKRDSEIQAQKASKDAEIQAQKAKHDAELKEKELQIEELKRTAPTGVPNQQVQFGSVEKSSIEKAHEIAEGYRRGYGLNNKR